MTSPLIKPTIETLRDCAEEIEAWVNDKWGDDPRLARQRARDTEPAIRARALADLWAAAE